MSSNAVPYWGQFLTLARAAAILAVVSGPALPLAAQDDTPATGEAAAAPAATTPPPPPRINLMVTVPRGEINQAQVQECEERADAGAISGEIVVCRQVGESPENVFSSKDEARKRYAEATALKNAPRSPDFIADCKDQGNPFGCVGFGGAPPPALMIDVSALPKAPAGSDADRIARGLPPLGQNEELTEEQEKARREALGIKVAPPPRPVAKGKR